VQKKPGDGQPIGTLQDDLLPDPVICRFPRFDVLIESIEQAQLLNKQRPELVASGGRAHGGVEPRKVALRVERSARFVAVSCLMVARQS
jgi:hypothetical protein